MIGRLLKRILLYANWIVIGLLLLGSLSKFVPAAFQKWVFLFGLAYPVLLFLNVLFVLFWVFFRKYYFLFSLVAILIGFRDARATFSIFPSSNHLTENGKHLKILSYNAHVFDLYNWSKKTQARDHIFKFVRTQAPDIACFQEYYNRDDGNFTVTDSLMANQRFRYSHIYYTTNLYRTDHYGIATFSIYPIVNKGVIRYKGTSNLTIYSDIKIGIDTIRVYNNHLESVRFSKDDYLFLDNPGTLNEEQRYNGAKGLLKRLNRASYRRLFQAQKVAEYIRKSPYPVIFCGDFNDVPYSRTYHLLSNGLNDSQIEQGWGRGITYPGLFISFRIDYILYSQSVNCLYFKVKKVNYSDHYPIVGEYMIQNR